MVARRAITLPLRHRVGTRHNHSILQWSCKLVRPAFLMYYPRIQLFPNLAPTENSTTYKTHRHKQVTSQVFVTTVFSMMSTTGHNLPWLQATTMNYSRSSRVAKQPILPPILQQHRKQAVNLIHVTVRHKEWHLLLPTIILRVYVHGQALLWSNSMKQGNS